MYKNHYSEIIAFGSIQTSILLSYRSIFISSQSILFAVATFAATQLHGSYFCYILFPVGIFLSVSWLRIDRDRGYDELFFDNHILNMEKGGEISDVYSQYYTWIKKTLSEKKLALKSGPEGKPMMELHRLSLARGVLGTILPILFIGLWIALLLFVLYRKYGVYFGL